MNTNKDTARHLNINVQDIEPYTSQSEASSNDVSKLIASFRMIPLTVPQRYFMPKSIAQLTLATGESGQQSLVLSPTTILSTWPEAFTFYKLNRLHINLRFIFRASWNMTGLVCCAWQPNRTSHNTSLVGGFGRSYCFSASPNMRSFARVGVDKEVKLSIPFVSQFAAMWEHLDLNHTPISGEANYSLVRIINITPIRSIPDAPQTVSVVVWAEPILIDVGAFVG